jgi:hypothetical protein
MKYMIMMLGDANTMMQVKSREWILDMIEFMRATDAELAQSGELVDNRGLADPSTAKVVRIVDGATVATDGPYAEAKESLAGYWIVDVADEARAVEIAAKVVTFTGEPIEVRQVMDAPPEM